MIATLFWRPAALAVGASLLAACGNLPLPFSGGDNASAVTTTAPADAPPRVRSEPGAALAAIPVPLPPPKRLATTDLVGQSSQDIGRLFGQPRLLRREAPAEVWQFPGSTCTLLVFLYPEESGPASSGLRVRHADAVPLTRSSKVSDEDCVESLLRLRPPPVS